MDGTTTGLWASLAAAIAALGWTLVRRLRHAKRIMPRGHLQVRFSLRSPFSSAPPAAERRRLFRRELVSLEEPAPSEPPIELEATDLEEARTEREELERQDRNPLSDRPTPQKGKRYRYP